MKERTKSLGAKPRNTYTRVWLPAIRLFAVALFFGKSVLVFML